MTGPSAELTTCGVFGNFRQACPLYIDSTEAPESLEAFAKRAGKPIGDFTCRGCRSDVVSVSCRACRIRTCAETRSVTFCVDCSEYPCAALRALAAKSVINPTQLMKDCAASRRDSSVSGWEEVKGAGRVRGWRQDHSWQWPLASIPFPIPIPVFQPRNHQTGIGYGNVYGVNARDHRHHGGGHAH